MALNTDQTPTREPNPMTDQNLYEMSDEEFEERWQEFDSTCSEEAAVFEWSGGDTSDQQHHIDTPPPKPAIEPRRRTDTLRDVVDYYTNLPIPAAEIKPPTIFDRHKNRLILGDKPRDLELKPTNQQGEQQ